MSATDEYTYRVEPKDGRFVGTCAEFPTFSWMCADEGNALNGIRRMVADSVDEIEQHGGVAPPPKRAE